MLKHTFFAFIALFIALLVSNFQPTNSAPAMAMLNRFRNGNGNQNQPRPVPQTGNRVNANTHTQPSVQNGIHQIVTPSVSRQSSIGSEKCPICFTNPVSDIGYFDCDKSVNHPKGHLMCDECVLKLTKTPNAKCPFCSHKIDEAKLNKLSLGKKAWALRLQILTMSKIILPEEYNPSGVKIPSFYQGNMANDLLKLIYSGISLPNVKDIVRNAIYAIQIIQKVHVKDKELMINCIHECILHSNKIIISDLFVKLVQPDQNLELIKSAVDYSFEQKKTSLLVTLVPKFSKKDLSNVILECILKAKSTSHFVNLFEIIRKSYPDKKSYYYNTYMKLSVVGARIDLSQYLTPEEKREFIDKKNIE